MTQLFVRSLAAAMLVGCLAGGCKHIDIYESTHFFGKQQWPSAVQPSFVFQIVDTTDPYQLYVVFRHSEAYNYNNLWMNIITQDPDSVVTTQRVELKLATNEAWLGRRAGDITDHRLLITRHPVNLKAGYYTFTLKQIMREDPLQGVLNAGIRVKKMIQ